MLDAEIDLAREFGGVDVEGLTEPSLGLGSATAIRDQIPESRRGRVQRIDPIGVEVDEHHLVVHPARDDARVRNEIGAP